MTQLINTLKIGTLENYTTLTNDGNSLNVSDDIYVNSSKLATIDEINSIKERLDIADECLDNKIRKEGKTRTKNDSLFEKRISALEMTGGPVGATGVFGGQIQVGSAIPQNGSIAFSASFSTPPTVNIISGFPIQTPIGAITTTNFVTNNLYTVASTTANDGLYTSLAVVDGYPAISYYDMSNFQLMFIRATDTYGTSWGSPIVVDTLTSNTGLYTSLEVVNGNPAIAYYDISVGDLRYIRASNADGSVWPVPSASNTVSSFSGFLAPIVGLYASLAVVNGRPAIACQKLGLFSGGELVYIRSNDADGTSWPASLTIVDTVPSITGLYASLVVVNNQPAISYFDFSNTQLKYVRSSDIDGAAWGSAQTIDTVGFTGSFTSLSIVNGRPAIAYLDTTNSNLNYIRANDISGISWPTTPKIVDTNVGSLLLFTSLQFINSRPSISYYDSTTGNLMYIAANDILGNSWPTSSNVIDSPGDVGSFTSLADVNGLPGISYYDFSNGNLKYALVPTVTYIAFN